MSTIVTANEDISAMAEAITGSPTMIVTNLQDANIDKEDGDRESKRYTERCAS